MASYQSFQDKTKADVRKFLPKKDTCDAIKNVADTKGWNSGKKTYTFLTDDEAQKKSYRAQFCYNKRKDGIAIIVGIAILGLGILIFLGTNIFMQYDSLSDVEGYWSVSMMCVIIGGIIIATSYFMHWRNDHKAVELLHSY
jgi:hypothetical protein